MSYVVFNIPIGTPINTTLINSMNHTANSTAAANWLTTINSTQPATPSMSIPTYTSTFVQSNTRCGQDAILEQIAVMDPDEFNLLLFRILKDRYSEQFKDGDIPFDYALLHLDVSGFTIPSGIYNLPDGAKLTVDYNTNYTINDKDAKVIYKANRNREFNEYVNVSDILDQFMKYAADLKLNKEQFLKLPIQTFIMWLIIQAAKKDGEAPAENEVKQLEFELTGGKYD